MSSKHQPTASCGDYALGCDRLKQQLVRKFETTGRLQYHCAANIINDVINNNAEQLPKKYRHPGHRPSVDTNDAKNQTQPELLMDPPRKFQRKPIMVDKAMQTLLIIPK